MSTKKLTLPVEVKDAFCDILSISDKTDSTDDVVAVLRVLRAVLPGNPQLAVSEAWARLNSGSLAEARDLLDETEAHFPEDLMVKAMKAYCLMEQRDMLWHSYANQVRETPDWNGNADVQGIMRLVEKYGSATV
jgi:Bacterial type III secretion protein (HrpB1_HrpK)